MTDLSDSRSPRESGADPSPGGSSLPRASLSHHVLSWVRGVLGGRPDPTLRDAIEELIEEADETPDQALPEGMRVLLGNILDLHERTVEDAMVPRADIKAIPISTPLPEVVRLMARTNHSRLPVIRDNLDEVEGIIHIKDVLKVLAEERQATLETLESLVRPVPFVAPSVPVLDMLRQMRETRQHMALVVDEYGGIDGLVTIEDLVEEIVGDIADEHDSTTEPDLIRRADGALLVDARLAIEDLEAAVGHVLSEEEREEVDTVAGLVMLLAGRIAAKGEKVIHASGLQFEVLEGDSRRIRRVLIHRQPGAGLVPAGNGAADPAVSPSAAENHV